MYIVQHLLYIDRLYWPGEKIKLPPEVAQQLMERGLLQTVQEEKLEFSEQASAKEVSQEPVVKEETLTRSRTRNR